ncbi:NfeD family protein [Myxococcota bacterium]
MALFLTLLFVGITLIVAEFFVPGGILGLTGGVSVAGAIVVAYGKFGATVGHAVLVAVALGAGVGVWWLLTKFPHSRLANPVVLRAAIVKPDHGLDHLVGQAGEAVTPLRPAGTAEIEGERIDVVTEGEFINAGGEIQVLRVGGPRVIVRKAGRV